MSRALTLDQTLKLSNATSAVLFFIFLTIAFLIKHHGVKVNVVTPQELKMVCGESNEINGEKNCFAFDR